MDLYTLFTLATAAFAGATMGSFLLITLLYPALLKQPTNMNDSLYIYQRLYRLNSAFCLLGGVCAALIKNQQAAFVLAILAVSYVFNHAHILKGMTKSCNEQLQVINDRAYRSLKGLQNLMHIAQFLGAGYAIYLLSIKPVN